VATISQVRVLPAMVRSDTAGCTSWARKGIAHRIVSISALDTMRHDAPHCCLSKGAVDMLKHLKFSMLALALSTSAGFSHEFWIDPLDYTVASGMPLLADLRVGQAFEGSPHAYIPVNFRL